MDALGWLIFLVALLVSVMLHETGHFVAAKRFGMKCTRYFVGFGPTIWSTWRGETEYGIKALPLGGFVKIVGMTSMDDVDPEDEPRSFRRAPGWQRLIVLAAGSFMHFVLAAVLIFGLALAIGIENEYTTQLGTVAPACRQRQPACNGTCSRRRAGRPPRSPGRRSGDLVRRDPVSTWTQLSNEILKVKPGAPVALTVLAGRAVADAAHGACRRAGARQLLRHRADARGGGGTCSSGRPDRPRSGTWAPASPR